MSEARSSKRDARRTPSGAGGRGSARSRAALLGTWGFVCAVIGIACGGGSAPAPATEQPPTVEAAASAPTVEALAEPTATPVTTVLFTGDIIPARCVYDEVAARGNDWTLPFQPLHPILSGADITVGTLDSTVSDVAEPIGCVETYNLAGPREVVDGLAYAGYDVISHAANHIKDCGNVACGDDAMLETAANLRAAGIAVVGADVNLAEARRPAVVERDGVRFAFLAYDDIAPYYHAREDAAGSAPLDALTIAEDIANARKVAEIVVVLPQWGVEYTAAPSGRQREVARIAAEAGATLVVGNHPHWVQGHEQIGDAFVAYALGNFLFDQDWSLETMQGAMLEVTFTGTRLTAWRYIPIRIHGRFQPHLAEAEESAQILQRIEDASVP